MRLLRLPESRFLPGLLGLHVIRIDARDLDWCFHGITTEGLTQFLVQHYLDKRGDIVIHLLIDCSFQGFGKHGTVEGRAILQDIVECFGKLLQKNEKAVSLHWKNEPFE